MSHVTTVKSQFQDLAALARACEAVGLTFKQDQKTFRDYYDNKACEHAITIPGSEYEIGLTQQPDGTWDLLYDNYTGDVESRIGAEGGTLKQQYNKCVVESAVEDEMNAHLGRCQTLANGDIEIEIDVT